MKYCANKIVLMKKIRCRAENWDKREWHSGKFFAVSNRHVLPNKFLYWLHLSGKNFIKQRKKIFNELKHSLGLSVIYIIKKNSYEFNFQSMI